MKKNKNIFLHIIEEDYIRKSKRQCFEVSGKAILKPESQQKEAFVVEQLRKLHEPFMVTIESECLEPNDELNQTNQQDAHESTNLLDDSKLNVALQKNAFVVEQLRKLHEPFMVTIESECLEPNDELNQTNQQDAHESTNLLDDSKLNVALQKLKSEGQELKDDKQDKLSRRKILERDCQKK